MKSTRHDDDGTDAVMIAMLSNATREGGGRKYLCMNAL